MRFCCLAYALTDQHLFHCSWRLRSPLAHRPLHHARHRITLPSGRSKCSCTCPGSLPPVTSTPNSMLIVKAYSVRFADDRNSHRPSATAHLTCRMPTLPLSSLAPLLLRPEVDRRASGHVVAQRPQRVVLVLAFELVRRLHDDVDLHAPPRRPHQRLADVRNPVDGVADQRDPLPGRVENLEDCLLRAPEGVCLGAGASPDQFDRLAFPVDLLGVARRPQRQGHGVRRHARRLALATGRRTRRPCCGSAGAGCLARPGPSTPGRSGAHRPAPRRRRPAFRTPASSQLRQSACGRGPSAHPKKAKSSRSTVFTSTERSRYLLPRSQHVSGRNEQAWHAAPCSVSPLPG